jgi:hypothetical protein
MTGHPKVEWTLHDLSVLIVLKFRTATMRLQQSAPLMPLRRDSAELLTFA